MRTSNLCLLGGAFLMGFVIVYSWMGIYEYEIDIPIKTERLHREGVLFLNDARYRFEPEPFMRHEQSRLLKSLKNARRSCCIVGLPEPVYELATRDYFVYAPIPFYQEEFNFFEDGGLVDAELPEKDDKIVREIISNVASRMKKRGKENHRREDLGAASENSEF